jgi:hypothetical protein
MIFVSWEESFVPSNTLNTSLCPKCIETSSPIQATAIFIKGPPEKLFFRTVTRRLIFSLAAGSSLPHSGAASSLILFRNLHFSSLNPKPDSKNKKF